MRERFKVAGSSKPNAIAGAIAGSIREGNDVVIQAIGAAAVNQTMKAAAIANGYLAPTGKTIICTPAFAECTVNGQIKTSLDLFISAKAN